MTQIRKHAVAVNFYPADADDLRFALRSMLGQISPVPSPPPKALIVPHAGYIYSCLLYTSDAADDLLQV